MKKLYTIIISLMLLFCAFVPLGASGISYAEEKAKSYTTAEEDLSKAENFDMSIFEDRYSSFDLSLEVVQIGVGESFNEVYVYVFVPGWGANRFTATSINISTSDNIDDLNYSNYELIPCDTDLHLHKYLVKDFSLPAISPVYINISSIFRKYNENFDSGNAESGGEISEVSYSVGKLYRFQRTIVDNEIVDKYECRQTETVVITAKTVGTVRYWNGIQLHYNYTDSHYVAFSTDRNIDSLLEADVEFFVQSEEIVYALSVDPVTTLGEKRKEKVTVTYSEKGEINDGWFVKEYNWDRIQSVSDFITKEDLTSDAETKLQGMQWVLRYYETQRADYMVDPDYGPRISSGTRVSEVTILRLKFVGDGKIYDLGVVDNKTTPDNVVDNENIVNFNFLDLDNLFSKILSVILIILLLIFLMPVMPYIAKTIVWVIMLPIKAIKAIVNAFKKDKTNGQTKKTNQRKKKKKRKK